MADILLTGASGLIGRATETRFKAQGHRVLRLVRTRELTGPENIFWDPPRRELASDQLNGLGAVFHLAGEPVARGRWTKKKKEAILVSRVESTTFLADYISKLERPPRVFICASATGFYGNREDSLLDEESAEGNLYLSQVCRQWEAACMPAVESGIRTVNLRLGAVLSRQGGALKAMLPAFRMGLGGKLASGNQWMSWISLEDAVNALLHCYSNSSLNGPVNLVSPNAVTNKSFTSSLANALNRPAFLTTPAFLLKALFGQIAEEILLSSARVYPAKLLQSGFNFKHPSLEIALRHLLDAPDY